MQTPNSSSKDMNTPFDTFFKKKPRKRPALHLPGISRRKGLVSTSGNDEVLFIFKQTSPDQTTPSTEKNKTNFLLASSIATNTFNKALYNQQITSISLYCTILEAPSSLS